jgi:hypothetical protein
LRHRGRSLFVLALGVIGVLLRQRVLLRKRLRAREVGCCDLQRRLVALHRRLLRVDLCLEGLLIHLKQDLARLDHGALGVHPLIEEAGYARLDIDRLRALGLGDVFG